jgi:fucose permease
MQYSVRRDLAATFTSFGLCGFVAGTWFSRIPAVRDHLAVGLGVVGLVLVGMGLGAFLTMPFGGRLTNRFSSRRVGMVAALGTAVFFSLLPFAQSPVLFGALLLLAGSCFGLWEVTLNVHGADVERAAGRSVMPALHGLWSAGVMAGSGVGAVLASADVAIGPHFWLLMPAAAVANLLVARGWHDHRLPAAAGGGGRPRMRALTLPVVLLAIMLICSNTAEGSASDWLALYAHDERGFGQGGAAAAFTTYSVTSTAGRLLGGFVVDRLRPTATLRLSGLVTCAGIAAVLFLPGAAGPFVGAALWGAGLAVVFPTAITIAGGHGGDNSAGAISAVSAMGYGAFLTAPPLIGLIAQHVSLGFALGCVMVLSLGITALAGRSTRPFRRSRPLAEPLTGK